MKKYYHPDTDSLRKLGVIPPVAVTHGTEEDLDAKRTPLKVVDWKLQGNTLIGVTADGIKMAQQIPTDYICLGMDDNGKPILKKIDL